MKQQEYYFEIEDNASSEVIVWYKYPEDVPIITDVLLIDYLTPEGNREIDFGQYLTNDFVSCEIDFGMCEVIAWAELPGGWKEEQE